MKQKKLPVPIFIVAVILFGIFLFIGSPNASLENGSSGSAVEQDFPKDRVPNVVLTDRTGGEVSISSFQGKPHVINSWATWCPFCVNELPDFVLLQEEFNEKIVVIAVNRQESVEKTEAFLTSINLGLEDLVFLYDKGDDFYRKIGGFSMPETLFVDADGNIVLHKRGFMEINEMREIVKKMLNS